MMNFCQDCHSNGCDQCVGGTTMFKRNYQYFCEYCSDIFGSACLFCQNYNGCGQCGSGYGLVKDSISGLKYCEKSYDPVPVACADCGQTGEVGQDWPAGEDPLCKDPTPTLNLHHDQHHDPHHDQHHDLHHDLHQNLHLVQLQVQLQILHHDLRQDLHLIQLLALHHAQQEFLLLNQQMHQQIKHVILILRWVLV